VVPHPKEVESYEESMLLRVVDIASLAILLVLVDTYQQLHHHVECDNPTLLVRVVDSPSSHDFLEIVILIG